MAKRRASSGGAFDEATLRRSFDERARDDRLKEIAEESDEAISDDFARAWWDEGIGDDFDEGFDDIFDYDFDDPDYEDLNDYETDQYDET